MAVTVTFKDGSVREYPNATFTVTGAGTLIITGDDGQEAGVFMRGKWIEAV